MIIKLEEMTYSPGAAGTAESESSGESFGSSCELDEEQEEIFRHISNGPNQLQKAIEEAGLALPPPSGATSARQASLPFKRGSLASPYHCSKLAEDLQELKKYSSQRTFREFRLEGALAGAGEGGPERARECFVAPGSLPARVSPARFGSRRGGAQ